MPRTALIAFTVRSDNVTKSSYRTRWYRDEPPTDSAQVVLLSHRAEGVFSIAGSCSQRAPWADAGRSENGASWPRRAASDHSNASAATLPRHQRGIVAHARYPINTGRLEETSDKIKVIERLSYGFRVPAYFTLKVKQAFPGS